MRSTIIVNPRARNGTTGQMWPLYRESISRHFGPARVLFTAGAGHAEQMTRALAKEGAGKLLVLGGDGTLNEVVNGLFSADGRDFIGDQITLVPYPAGTGQDFARSVGVSSQLKDFRPLFLGATTRRVDVGRLTLTGRCKAPKIRHFINIASAGMSADIVELVARHRWPFGQGSVFLGRTLQALSRSPRRRIRFCREGEATQVIEINSLILANGRFFGGGMQIAPRAFLDDGLFDVVILKDMSRHLFIAYATRLYRGEHTDLPQVEYVRGRKIYLSDEPETVANFGPTPMECDGELPGYLPASCEVLPQKISVWAPWFDPGTARLLDSSPRPLASER